MSLSEGSRCSGKTGTHCAFHGFSANVSAPAFPQLAICADDLPFVGPSGGWCSVPSSRDISLPSGHGTWRQPVAGTALGLLPTFRSGSFIYTSGTKIYTSALFP